MVADRRREAGSAMIMAILAIFLISGAVMVVGSHLQTRFADFRLEERQVTLIALTDAAMAEALAHLRSNPRFLGRAERPFAAGTIASTVVAGAGGELAIIVRATFAGWWSEARAELAAGPTGPQVVHWQRRQGPRSRS